MRIALSVLFVCLVFGTGECMSDEYAVHPIGEVKNVDGQVAVKILPRYREAMFGLEQFSHVIVLYWFDKNDTPEKRAVLKVHPRGDERNPLTGVFATRSPMRPNLIGFSVCKVKSVDSDGITVEEIDAFDKTPVLDVKPYIPHSDSIPDAKVPKWVKTKTP